MKSARICALFLLAIAVIGGCTPRLKGLESREAALTPNPIGHPVGDPYANGGTAMASGGTHPVASTATSQPTVGSL